MTAFNTDVTVAVEIGFGDDPYTLSPTWVDVTADVRQVTISRGRSHDVDRVSASSLALVIDNTSGDYDPTYTGGTHYPNVTPMVPIRVTATHSVTTYDLFYGMVDAWPMSWPSFTDSTIDLTATDGLKLLNLMNTNTAEAQEATGVRVGNLLDDAGWPSGWRTVATGDVTAQAFTPACTSILSLIRQVEDTEAGLFFIDGAGNAVFQDQTHRSGASSTATFGDDGAEVKYETAVLTFDDLQVHNRIEVSRVGGATVGAENAASIANFGKRLLSRFDTLHVDDTEATTLATNMLTRYNDPHVFVDSLTINPLRGASWATVLGLEVSDLVTVKRRPPAGNTISLDVFVESIRTEINPRDRRWLTTISGTQYV